MNMVVRMTNPSLHSSLTGQSDAYPILHHETPNDEYSSKSRRAHFVSVFRGCGSLEFVLLQRRTHAVEYE